MTTRIAVVMMVSVVWLPSSPAIVRPDNAAATFSTAIASATIAAIVTAFGRSPGARGSRSARASSLRHSVRAR